MLTVKDLKELLSKYMDDTVILLYDANRSSVGNPSNSVNNSFENILPCHIQNISMGGKELLVKPNMLNEETKEFVWGFIHPDNEEELKKGKKALLLSPDSLDVYKEKQ